MLAELYLPDFPLALGYVWSIFNRIRRRLPAGMTGPQPIGWVDIVGFTRLTGVQLDAFEVGLIEDIDEEYLAAWHAINGKSDG